MESIDKFTFIDDKEKIKDLLELSKDDFLKSYSYIRESEYDNTKKAILKAIEYFNRHYQNENLY